MAPDARFRPSTDEVHTAIARVEASRQTHVEWRDYWLATYCAGCEDCRRMAAVAGDLDHQEACIAGYDQVLGVLRSLL